MIKAKLMKRLAFAMLIVFQTICVVAQDNTGAEKKEKPVEVKISGFILNNMFLDTRKNVDALDGLLLLFPQPEMKNSNGEDLNDVENATLLSFASRLKFAITGPDALGAKTSGFMEYDFTARANSVTLRFRQAWAKLAWENSELLIGRAWHPMASMDVIPSVMALSIGAPFQPFNRSEQITFTQKFGKTHLILSALYQNDYTNNGPLGKSYTYQTNALLPNLHAQVKYKSDNIIAGVGFDYKLLKPRTEVIGINQIKSKADETIGSYAILAYGQVKSGKLTVSGKSIYAANISESLMPGAFAISSYDAFTGKEEYTNYKHFFIWGNISYGGALKASLFSGYFKNLGASENIVAPTAALPSTVFGLGEKIGEMIRIVPTVSYTSGKVILAFEIEHNIAAYGTINYARKGEITGKSNVSSTRFSATMYYNF
ncbi:MAG TPA: hypothetical protein VHO72_08765 [Bacteroidales bacterium]|nr:hypothetical protein [Bacteroidales bacterium]